MPSIRSSLNYLKKEELIEINKKGVITKVYVNKVNMPLSRNVKDFLISSGFTGNDLTEAVNTSELNREFDWDNYFDTTDSGSTFNKYNNNGGLTILESIDDAATVHMGSRYRIPTIDEIRELLNNTIQTFIDLNDTIYSKEQAENGAIEEGKLKGVRFTGSNGNSIFIPTAGAYTDSLLVMSGVSGVWWSSSLCDSVAAAAWGCAFNYVADNIIGEELGFRGYGLPVRGVKEPYKKYLTFKAEEDNSSIGLKALSSNQNMEYSTDTVTWNTFDTTTDILLSKDEEVYIRGILNAANHILDTTTFKMSGKIAAYGSCNALWNYEDLNAPLKEFCGAGMFADCTSLTIAPELPATTLAIGCYMGMFNDCTLLTTAPELPATTLASYCYTGMFENCESLTTAPELPATTLADYCYNRMFFNCISLTTTPELPATTLASTCYTDMFRGCTSLTIAPEILPATTLVTNCYGGMFYDCFSLTTAPELPAIELAEYCYSYMFWNCTSLTAGPELPATTLAESCYQSMFSGCTSLTAGPELPATTLAESCYQSMFSGCTSLTAGPELPATTLTESCYQSMFSGCTKLNYIKCLATDISPTDCTYYWSYDIARTGTFIKHPDMNNWTTGINGIPTGWTVENAVL